MAERILFVDDEQAVLDGYRRLLSRDFPIDTAIGGEAALAVIAESGPYAVVVSDMRMPVMNGAEFLSRVKTKSPDSTRIMLTGYADIDSAIRAVNDGNVFRFLMKPCPQEVLLGALSAGLAQHRLVVAERELLENTLRGSIQVMTEVLSVTNPAAFGRATRLQRYVRHMVAALGLTNWWHYEVSAMLSQLGCITLHPDTINAVNAGEKLSPQEQEKYDRHTAVAWDLLSRIPRMEAVAWIIMQQQGDISDAHGPSLETNIIRNGSHLLRTALEYDRLLNRGRTHDEAIEELRVMLTGMERDAALGLRDLEPTAAPAVMRMCKVSELLPGMILDEEVRTNSGILMVAKGQEVTLSLRTILKTYLERGSIRAEIRVRERQP